MARLDRYNKFDVKIGDTLQYTDGSGGYIVTNILHTYYPSTGEVRGVSFTIQDKESKRQIYGYPSSQLYGLEWIPQGGAEA